MNSVRFSNAPQQPDIVNNQFDFITMKLINKYELRIGNLFNPKNPTAVEPWMLLPHNKVEFEPIALSDEWMDKFGWTNIHGAWTKTYEHIAYQLEKSDGWILLIDVNESGNPPGFKVEFVHHFQNIIHALTGEEQMFSNDKDMGWFLAD